MGSPAKNKRDGTRYETDLVNFFRDLEFEADRLRLSGKEDEGDLVVRLATKFLIFEAKAGKNVRPRYWYEEEAVPEATTYARRRRFDSDRVVPVLAMKSHNKSIGKTLVTLSLEDLMRLVGGEL